MDKWLGGACPVDPDAVVEFELRDGTRSQSRAGLLRWRHLDPAHPKDVVAFRAVVPVPVWDPEFLASGGADARQEGGDHYKRLGVEPWAAMRAWMTPEEFRGFLRGNAIKYLARCNLKGGDEDLRKAKYYVDKLVEVLVC